MKDWRLYAKHILDCIEKINKIQQRGDITEDVILYDATLRNMQTLAEATQNLPEDIKQAYSNIPWKQISAFRNVLVHNYLGDIDPETVGNVLVKHLPDLKQSIEDMLRSEK